MIFAGQSFLLTTTAVITVGATSATLSAGFSGTTGTYLVQFSSGEVRSMTLTNASTAMSWTNGLLLAATTQVICNNATTYPGNSDLYYASGQHTHPNTAGHQYIGLARADALYALIKNL
jgi:hypothetical protein